MLTWSSAPVVSESGPLFYSSEAISGCQHQNTQLLCGYLGCGSTPCILARSCPGQ